MKENKKLYNVFLLFIVWISYVYFKNAFSTIDMNNNVRLIVVMLITVYMLFVVPKQYSYRPVKVYVESVDELEYLDE